MNEETVLAAVRRWLDTFIVGMQLCPFAAAPLAEGRVRLAVTGARSDQELIYALLEEIRALDADPNVETSLLIHPRALNDFDEYNQFLDVVDAILEETDREGVYQVASFHPDYQFDGTAPDAAENYTNRSPFPLLHLLRESSISRVLDTGVDTNAVPERNILRMNAQGTRALAQLLADCLQR